jgi:hypothetical protein
MYLKHCIIDVRHSAKGGIEVAVRSESNASTLGQARELFVITERFEGQYHHPQQNGYPARRQPFYSLIEERGQLESDEKMSDYLSENPEVASEMEFRRRRMR